MAEAWLNHFGGDKIMVKSAGTRPEGVNHFAIRVLEEVGIDIFHHTSNHVDEYADDRFDYVITVCNNAKEACPFIPAKVENIHHSFTDPANATGTVTEQLEVYRTVRDEIKVFSENFVSKLFNDEEE